MSLISRIIAGSPDGNTFTTPPIDTTNANLLIAAISYFTSVTPTLSDSFTNTWNGLTAKSSVNATSRLFYAFPATAGINHTFTLTGTAFFGSIAVLALSDALSSPFDVENGAFFENVGGITPGDITTNFSNELIVTALAHDPGISNLVIDTGFSILTSLGYVNAAHQGIALATHTQEVASFQVGPNWNWTGSVGAASVIAAFKATLSNPKPFGFVVDAKKV